MVLPVVTPDEMREIDAAAPTPVEELIERAGWHVARHAIELMGGAYGRRVVVVCGKGNNGRDGVAAGRVLARRGATVELVDAAEPPDRLGPCDLVIDAAYGTGFRGVYSAPRSGDAPVLAVDIPSGVDGLTGVASGSPARATRTVTFAALKPGLLFADGAALAGDVRVADIGLDVGVADISVVTDADVTATVPRRPRDAHKWRAALWVVGGSPRMGGAPALAASAALSAGAGYVRLSSPGARVPAAPIEAVHHDLPLVGWDRDVTEHLDRIAALVIGPGLGRSEAVRDSVRSSAGRAGRPAVIDGDGLWAIAELEGRLSDHPRVLTPHDGEFTQLTGHPPGADRIAAARRLAADRRAVVLLKGPTTVVAAPSGSVRLVTSGDARLATAGTGDVLAGVIGALLAAGVDAFEAAAVGAHIHGLAARRGPAVGLRASRLAEEVASVLSDLVVPAAAP